MLIINQKQQKLLLTSIFFSTFLKSKTTAEITEYVYIQY